MGILKFPFQHNPVKGQLHVKFLVDKQPPHWINLLIQDPPK